MKIKVLGSGCTKCEALEKITLKAIEELNIDADFKKSGDIEEILSYHILRTPALVIDEKVVISGEVPSMIELKSLLIASSRQ